MSTSIDHFDIALRLIVAVLAGMIVGLDREWRGKPVGIRTLALVSLGSALICVATVHLTALQGLPDATSRVVQGVTDVADLDEALATIPDKVASGYRSICFKPSMFTDHVADLPDICRRVVAALDTAA